VTDTSQRFTGERDHNLPITFPVPFWLAATHDGKTVAFDQPGWEQAQIMLVDNFR